MKTFPKIRKALKWAGVALTLALLALWLWSGMYSWGRMSSNVSVLGSNGRFTIWRNTSNLDDGWYLDKRTEYDLRWWEFIYLRNPSDFSQWILHVSGWSVALLAAIGTGFVWHRDIVVSRRELKALRDSR